MQPLDMLATEITDKGHYEHNMLRYYFNELPHEDLEKAYELLVAWHLSKDEGIIVEVRNEGYTRESIARYLATSYLLHWGINDMKAAKAHIPDLKKAESEGLGSLLEKISYKP